MYQSTPIEMWCSWCRSVILDHEATTASAGSSRPATSHCPDCGNPVYEHTYELEDLIIDHLTREEDIL